MKKEIQEYVERIVKGMTESSKGALFLLFSVILLTGVILGIALPLREACEGLKEQTRLTEKEIGLLEAYASDAARAEKRLRGRLKSEALQRRFASRPDMAAEVRRLYEAAGRYRVTVQALRRHGAQAGAGPDTEGNRPVRKSAAVKKKAGQAAAVDELSSLTWDIELSGEYPALRDFLQEISAEGRCTTFSEVSLRPEEISSGEKDRLRFRGLVSVFYDASLP